MLKIGDIQIENALLLAPMEALTDMSFRLICRELGADIVYTEFVNSEGLVRSNEKTHQKLKINEAERPVGIQIYGGDIKSMAGAARIAEAENPDLIDINAGCWVKNVVGCGAGAGLLKDPPYLQKLVSDIVKSVSKPVTVKTRIGWDNQSIKIVEIARRLEDAGIKALTVHCRTRAMGHRGDPDWEWINRVKEVVSYPVILNGGIMSAADVKKAFTDTDADGLMIARGAIGNPYIFRESKELLDTGSIVTSVDEEMKINIALKHLRLACEIKGEKRAVIEHRKFYSGYLKGMYNASKVRNELMKFITYKDVESKLISYLEELKSVKNEKISA
ncbi:MAG: tRNA dihydrouridine synthase DusB [Ignavibacteriaceae bacterium]